jgi:hypothetical protein
MKRVLATVFVASLLIPAVAMAQKPKSSHGGLDEEISIGEIPPTQEMWFYQQELTRQQDPKLAIRRRAEFRAAQRERRLASQEWYGISPLRPNANVTPWTGGLYSPGWTGNTREPFRWMPQAPIVVIRSAQSYSNGIYGVW